MATFTVKAKPNFLSNYDKSNMRTCKDLTFLYEPFDKNTFFWWIGGHNGSGQPQLPRKGTKNQIAAREIFKLFYGEHAALLNSKDYVNVRITNRNMNPYKMILENTKVSKNHPERYLDVSNENSFRARIMIESFLKNA